MNKRRARWIFWAGITSGDCDARLRVMGTLSTARASKEYWRSSPSGLDEVDNNRRNNQRPVDPRDCSTRLVDGLRYQRSIRGRMWWLRAQLLAEVRRVMAIVGIDALSAGPGCA